MWSLRKDLNLGVRFVYRVVYWSPAAEVVKDTYLNEKEIKFALLMMNLEPIFVLFVLIIGIDWNKSLWIVVVLSLDQWGGKW